MPSLQGLERNSFSLSSLLRDKRISRILHPKLGQEGRAILHADVCQHTQRVHVGILWYILRAQRGSHIPTLTPKYAPYSYMGPLGHG